VQRCKELIEKNEFWGDIMNIEKNDVLESFFYNLGVVYSIRYG